MNSDSDLVYLNKAADTLKFAYMVIVVVIMIFTILKAVEK